jgi:hypothetical protein
VQGQQLQELHLQQQQHLKLVMVLLQVVLLQQLLEDHDLM